MDYMQLIRKSLEYAWKFKFLWLFGFFAVLQGGGGGGGGGGRGNIKFDHWHIEPALLVFIIFAALILIVILLLLAVWSEGALIHGIHKKESGQKTNFSDCSKAGLNKFASILGIKLFAIVAVIASLIVMAIFLVPAFIASVIAGIALAIVFLPVFLILIFLVVSVEGWAMRYVIVKENNCMDAISNGWILFRSNVSKTIGVAFSSFLTKLLFGIMIFILLGIMALPAILLGIATLGLALIPLIALGLIILVLTTAYFGTFGSSVWTLGFIQITK
ncbi:hypothetical protein ACFLT9_04115 [Acidobacteriota bacterium]